MKTFYKAGENNSKNNGLQLLSPDQFLTIRLVAGTVLQTDLDK
jgi:hypothetical protein